MTKTTTRPRLSAGLRYMVLAAFFFSLMSLTVKLAGRRLPATEIVFARALVSLVATWILLRRARVPLWGHRKGLLAFRGLAGFGGLICFFWAVTKLPLADVTVIHFTNPVFTAIFAALFLEERIGRAETAGLALSLAGLVLVAQPSFLFGGASSGLDLVAVGVALLGALFAAAAYTVVRKLGETEHHLMVVFYFPLVATPASVPLLWHHALVPTPAELLLLLAVGLCTQIAQVYLTKGLHAERAGKAMSMSYVQIVFAAAWGFLFFHEVPGLLSAAGALLIVAGTLVVSRARTDAGAAPTGGPEARE